MRLDWCRCRRRLCLCCRSSTQFGNAASLRTRRRATPRSDDKGTPFDICTNHRTINNVALCPITQKKAEANNSLSLSSLKDYGTEPCRSSTLTQQSGPCVSSMQAMGLTSVARVDSGACCRSTAQQQHTPQSPLWARGSEISCHPNPYRTRLWFGFHQQRLGNECVAPASSWLRKPLRLSLSTAPLVLPHPVKLTRQVPETILKLNKTASHVPAQHRQVSAQAKRKEAVEETREMQPRLLSSQVQPAAHTTSWGRVASSATPSPVSRSHLQGMQG